MSTHARWCFVATMLGAAAQLVSPTLTHAAQKAAAAQATWWGHAAFVLESPKGTVIAIDPWLKNPKAPTDPAKAAWPTKVDAILVTHGHSDHVGDAVELAKKTGAQLIGSFELTVLLGVKNSAGGNIGGSIKVKDVTVNFVEAVHSSGLGSDPANLKYAGPAMGYVLQMEGGPTIYHAGDTSFFASMALIAEQYKPNVALLPIGGHFTMDPDGAALAVKLLKPAVVVPMHFGTFPMLAGTPEGFKAALKKRGLATKVLVFEPGQKANLP